MKKLISILAVMTVVLTFSVVNFSAAVCVNQASSGCNCVSGCSACAGVQGANHLSVTGGTCSVCGGGTQAVQYAQPVQYAQAVTYAIPAMTYGTAVQSQTYCPMCYSTRQCNCNTDNFMSPVAPVYVTPVSSQTPTAKTVSVNDTGGGGGGGGGVSIVDVGGGKMSPITGDNFGAVSMLGLMFMGIALYATRKLVK